MSNQESQAEPTPTPNGITVGRQALRRRVNRRVRSLTPANELTATIDVFCECGRRLCADRVQLEAGSYDQVLDSPEQYVISTHHDQDGTQRLVSRHHGFLVVERRSR